MLFTRALLGFYCPGVEAFGVMRGGQGGQTDGIIQGLCWHCKVNRLKLAG